MLILAAGLVSLALKGAQASPPLHASQAVCKLAGPDVAPRWSTPIPKASDAPAPLRVQADVPLPGTASRFDYQSLEQSSGRLFISHMGAGQLVVFDVGNNTVLANLDGFSTVTGVLAVPAPRAHTVAVDSRTHRVYLPLANIDGHPVLRILTPTDAR